MTVLTSKIVSGGRFHWHGNEGVAEMSDLEIPGFGQVYDDACDEGLTVIGHRELVTFVVVGTNDNDGEVTGWRLASINDKTGRVDGRFKLLIIND